MNRRNFVSSLIAPLIAVPVIIQGQEGTRTQTFDDKGRYVFHFPNLRDQNQMEAFQKHLEKKGYKECLVVGGSASEGFQLFRLHHQCSNCQNMKIVEGPGPRD